MNENANASLVNQIFSKLYEAVSLVGLQLVMFAFAIVVYFLFTGTGSLAGTDCRLR